MGGCVCACVGGSATSLIVFVTVFARCWATRAATSVRRRPHKLDSGVDINSGVLAERGNEPLQREEEQRGVSTDIIAETKRRRDITAGRMQMTENE